MNFKTFTGSTGKIYVWRSKRLSEEDISTPAISYNVLGKKLTSIIHNSKKQHNLEKIV